MLNLTMVVWQVMTDEGLFVCLLACLLVCLFVCLFVCFVVVVKRSSLILLYFFLLRFVTHIVDRNQVTDGDFLPDPVSRHLMMIVMVLAVTVLLM